MFSNSPLYYTSERTNFNASHSGKSLKHIHFSPYCSRTLKNRVFSRSYFFFHTPFTVCDIKECECKYNSKQKYKYKI